MFFDDRLATVLRQRATGEAGLRTQYRQLLDLLGHDRAQGRTKPDQSLLAAAWLRMDQLAEAIPAADRARMIREPGWRFLSAGLALHLTDHEPEVAAAALARADLTPDEWTALIPRLPVRARGFVRMRRDLPVDVEALLVRLGVHDRGLPAPDRVDEAPESQPAAAEHGADSTAPESLSPTAFRPALAAQSPRDRETDGRSEISALVERIARFRRERGETLDLERSPRLPLEEVTPRDNRIVGSFGFATDAAGRIAWAASDVAPMLIGTRLAGRAHGSEAGAAPGDFELAFARRQPVRGAKVDLLGAPAISGSWQIDAEPRFSEAGHFTGYLGRFRRQPVPGDALRAAEVQEADHIRQLLHELRTPVTAVQGYAEVIQQQLFGPAPHEYRALAAAIAADAARILAGFDELDRLARLETGTISMEPGETDLAELIRRSTAHLAAVLQQRDAGFAITFAPTAARLVPVDPDDAEMLIWRLLATLGAGLEHGEAITIGLDPMIGPGGAVARMVCGLPKALAQSPNLFAATLRSGDNAINAGLFGAGFALRLARAEARAAGGQLRRDGDVLELTLPLLTDVYRSESPEAA